MPRRIGLALVVRMRPPRWRTPGNNPPLDDYKVQLIPIRIPVYKGLCGWRLLAIRECLDRARLGRRRVLALENPLLSPETPLDQARLWFRP